MKGFDMKGFDIKGFEEFQSISKDNMDAAIASVAVWTKGWQAIAAECADFSKKSFEESTQAMEKAIAAKSLDKAFEVQAEFAKSAYEGFMGQANKIGEMYISTARDAFSPIEKRVHDAA